MGEPIPEGHHRVAPTFNFRVTLRRTAGGTDAGPERLGDGGFQECSGLEVEMDAQELKEGGRNDGVVRLVGRGKYTNIVLKRGMFHPADGAVDDQLWSWIQGTLAGTGRVARYDGTIEVLDRAGERGGRTVASWSFERGLPVRVRGPELNAKTGDIAIEELHIAHEGLRFER